MREIKFRVFLDATDYDERHPDCGKKRMLNWDDLTDGTDDLQCYINNEVAGCSLAMQYTGLKDDDKCEIYEGDILYGSYGIPGRRIEGVVEYDGSSFIVKTPGHTPDISTLFKLIDYLGGVWIIGNIYENPELITNN